MNDLKQNGEEVTWKIAIRVWWAQTWREIAAVTIILFMPAIFVSIFMKGNITAAWIIYIALFTFIFPITIWATWQSLEANYGSFSIVIKKREEDEAVTWKIALRVWWAQMWRGIVVNAIIQMLVAVLLAKFVGITPVNRDAMSLLFIPITIWAVWQSLQLHYGSFSISIRETAECGPGIT